MPTRIFLIRHGDTEATAGNRFTGSMDIPLSKDGRMHASELATRLSNFDVKAVYSSSMQRAHDTAGFIANVHSLQVNPLDALREIDHGKWDGMAFAEVEQQFPGQLAQYQSDLMHFKPDGGESGEEVLQRAVPVLEQIVTEHPDQDVAIVAHQTTNLLLICHALKLDFNSTRKFGQHPACLSVLIFNGGDDVKLQLLNDISHYRLGASVSPIYVA